MDGDTVPKGDWQGLMVIFDPKTMPTPLIIAFTSCEGLQLGRVMEWINKLWRVRLNTGMSCFVAPDQIEWMA